MSKQKPYSLVGVDGNAYALMGYTSMAMKNAGFTKEDENKMYEDATSGDYYHLIGICNEWITKVNEKLGLK